MIVDFTLTATTDGSGDASTTGVSSVVGRVVAIAYDFSACDATADTTISFTGDSSGVDRTVAVYTNNNGTGFDDIVDDALDATGSASGTDVHPLVSGKPKMVVDEGGASNAATVHIFVDVDRN